MSFSSSKHSSNFEKYYYNNIYKNSGNGSRRTNTQSNFSILGANLRHSFAYHSKSLYSSSPQSVQKESEYMDPLESESIISSIRRYGIESPSFSSVLNLRNLSYLQSRDHDCVETLLLQMEPTLDEVPTEEMESLIPAVDLKPDPIARSKIVKFGRRARKNCRSGLNKVASWIRAAKKLAILIGPIDFQSKFYILWLAFVSFAYIYNLITITLRYSFGVENNPEGYLFDIDNSTMFRNESSHAVEMLKGLIIWFRQNRLLVWFVGDLGADLIYLIDIFIVQTRIKFIREGLWVMDKKSMATNYLKSPKFYLDIFSIVPFDALQVFLGTMPLLRINRCIKIKSLWEFFDRWDRSVQSYVFIIRLIKLFTYLQIVIHLYACSYYKLSAWETKYLNVSNEWVYDVNHTEINSYVYSFLFGLKTASTIGNNPQPHTKYEYLFTAIAYVLALFLFALIVGQIRNIIGSQTTKQDAFLIVLDSTIRYVKGLNLPDRLMQKVVMWFDYYAHEQNAIPFQAIKFLPINVQTDLAIEVYFELLSKVKLFQECEKNLLYSLVLKLEPVIYMPGDYICKKGDVGREMFIVDQGVVEVIVNDKAVAKMAEGSYFGEISLLSMGDGGNRRTANVVSKGFSKLLVLHKSDLDEVLQNYPGMEEILRKTADTYLKKK